MDRPADDRETADRSTDLLDRIHRIRGVSWQWREDVAVEELSLTPGAAQAGVIAQEVQAVFPELVAEGRSGYLMVDYGGLAVVVARAVAELRARAEALPGGTALSDERFKDEVDPLADVLSRLDAGEALGDSDYQGLVGALVEAVKELDGRLTELERRAVS